MTDLKSFNSLYLVIVLTVDSLIVNTDDAQCWGVGSEIHVGTSAYYSFNGHVANSFNTVIKSISDNNDGTSSVGLAVSPNIPIVSKAEDEDSAADVALLSRNFKVISGDEEDKKGAYLQVLHTPGIAQIIEGVKFEGMGRRGEEDRYPLQLLYSGSVEGTIIDKNTIQGSNMRCIAIQGTGNAIVSNNVAASNHGHCIYVGNQAQDNLIQENFISDTIAVSLQDRVQLESVCIIDYPIVTTEIVCFELLCSDTHIFFHHRTIILPHFAISMGLITMLPTKQLAVNTMAFSLPITTRLSMR